MKGKTLQEKQYEFKQDKRNGAVIDYHRAGTKNRDIARDLNLTQRQVTTAIKKYYEIKMMYEEVKQTPVLLGHKSTAYYDDEMQYGRCRKQYDFKFSDPEYRIDAKEENQFSLYEKD